MAGKEGEADAASDITTTTDALKAMVRRETLALLNQGAAKDAAERESLLKQIALIARAQTLIATSELTMARAAEHQLKAAAGRAAAAVLSGPERRDSEMKTIDEMEGEELERTLAELERKMAVVAAELGRGRHDVGAADARSDDAASPPSGGGRAVRADSPRAEGV